MKSYAITDVGKTRSSNQDYVFASENAVGSFPNLFVVADGMGGHNAGDFASRFCVDEFVKMLCEKEGTTYLTILEKAIMDTNRKLIEVGKDKEELDGMGTTFVAAVVFDDYMYVMNIGDSRLYLINHEIRQITEDHSLVAEMVKSGDLKYEEARFHPKKNVVTRAISTMGVVCPDFFEVPIKKGDKILLCSDGLSSMVSDTGIFNIVKRSEKGIEKAASKLVETANENGGKDNISVILIQI